MKLLHLVLPAIAVGLVLIVAGLIWPKIMGPGRVWTDEQAHQHTQVSAKMHEMVHKAQDNGGHGSHHGHGHASAGEEDPAAVAAEFEEARQGYEKSRAALESAKSMRHGPAVLLKWGGLLLMALGVVGYFVDRASAS